VVDDDDFQRQVLSSILTSEHYSLGFATSGEGALEAIRHKRPDLILMDILMPGMDGIEATRQIKTDPVMAAVPIIIISGQNQRETVLECIAKGAADYIVKPYNKATLISKIQDAIKAGSRKVMQGDQHAQT
jgi:CheY-like chemotaxis protein